MVIVWALLAVTATGQPVVADRILRSSADTVFQARFEDSEDVNYDRWPDFWKRRSGTRFPHYLKIEMARDPLAKETTNHALRIQLDGSGAELRSPPIPASPLFSYLLRARIRTVGLKHDVASISVRFQDKAGKVLEQRDSPMFRRTTEGWVPLMIGPMTPRDARTRQAVVVLRLVPESGIDLKGEAWFDDLWLGRLPRMSLTTNAPGGIYGRDDPVEVRCTVSGSGEDFPDILFQLRDESGKVIDQSRQSFAGNMIGSDSVARQSRPGTRREFAGTTSWTPAIPGPGYYEVQAEMSGDTENELHRTIAIAVISDPHETERGEFGWSLPEGEHPFSVKDLVNLLPQLCVHWVKFPAWYGADTPDVGEKLAWFSERLAAKNIEMVGMLDRPPSDVLEHLPNGERLSIAAIFLDSDIWQPSIDPVMVRLSLKVKWWQLGGDDDFSFIAFPRLAAKISEIKRRFDQFGQKTKIGMSWKWLVEQPGGEAAPWAFLSYSEQPPFTGKELADYVSAASAQSAHQWVMLRPLSKSQYDRVVRMKDLVARMVAAKVHGADAIIATNPFDAETGLLTPEGYPTELLLPWVTTAKLLGGATYLGQLHLPNGSPNFVFQKDGQAILVGWSGRPTKEVLYLGEAVTVHDMWGRTHRAPTIQQDGFSRQVITLAETPVFVTGINLEVTQWRLAFQFDRTRLDSLFGREQATTYRFTNTFSGGVGGKLRLVLPPQWETDYHGTRFRLLGGDTQVETMRVTLGVDATSGPQPVRVDFDITARRRYKFSVYRMMEVGLGDVTMEVVFRIDAEGNLVVDQHLDNQSEQPISFNCMLSAPGRRRMRQSVFHLRQGRTTVTFVLPHGDQLVGKRLRVRAEEIRGNRLLNYQFVVKP